MTEENKARRVQQMVPDPDKVIEHGLQPAQNIRPPAPPANPKNGGIGSPKKG